jgi:sortase A
MRAAGTIDSVSEGLLLRWIPRILLVAGSLAIAWCVAVVGETALVQAAVSVRPAVPPPPAALPTPLSEASRPLASPLLAVGTAIARLSIPRLAMSAVVLHGSDEATLLRGPGHIPGTAVPGNAGNAAIAGHRDTFFRALRDIAVGDDVYVDTGDGRVHYRVTATRVVGPREVSVLAPTADTTLTLITCYPFWVLGPAPDRFIVRAARVES